MSCYRDFQYLSPRQGYQWWKLRHDRGTGRRPEQLQYLFMGHCEDEK